jgi:hypothetical protein
MKCSGKDARVWNRNVAMISVRFFRREKDYLTWGLLYDSGTDYKE